MRFRCLAFGGITSCEIAFCREVCNDNDIAMI